MPSSGYTAITFVADELLTSTKMNLMAANDAAFNNGNGLEDNSIIARHINAAVVSNSKLALNAIGLGDVESNAAEAGTGVWSSYAVVPNVNISVTTTKANQKVLVLCRLNMYQGAVTNFKFQVDGADAGYPSKVPSAVLGPTTTAQVVMMDILTIATAGAHTIRIMLQQGASSLRVINSEGRGQLVAIAL